MNIVSRRAFHAKVDLALAAGPAQVDRIVADPRISALVCVRGDDGSYYWITYHDDGDRMPRSMVLAVRPPGGSTQIVHGAGCVATGFLLGAARDDVFELLALAHHPMSVVRGTAADFAGVGSL